jgi:PcaR/PcaU/PobR family beta-ketoadipate pathway transcriptional regulator
MRTSSLSSIYHVESLARGLAVLSAFSEEQPDMSLTNISQRLQLNKTTTFRLLSTLETSGYIVRDQQTKLYRPGLEVLRLGFLVLNNIEVRQIAAPYLRRLVDEVEETVNLAVLDGHEVIYIDRVGSKHLVNVYRPVGSRLPAYCTSTGKVMLAYLPPDQLEAALAATTWERYTQHTLTTPESLKDNLALIRERGFSDSDGEMILELRDVSAPIYQHDEQVVAAINISVPAHRVSYEELMSELGPRVVRAGWKISEALGYNVKHVM